MKVRSIFVALKNRVSDLKDNTLFYVSNSSWTLRSSVLLLAVLLTTAVVMRPTLAATTIMVPDGVTDRTASVWLSTPGCTDHTCVNAAGTPSDTTYVYTDPNSGVSGDYLEFSLTDVANVASTSRVVVTLRASAVVQGGTADDFTFSLRNGITVLATSPTTIVSATWTDYTLTYDGNLTQTDVNNLRIRVTRTTAQGTGPGGGRDDEFRVSNYKADLTYVVNATFQQASYRWFGNDQTITRADSFTAITTPSGTPETTGVGTAISPDGQYLSVAHQFSPYLAIHKLSGGKFTKIADPDVMPASTGRGTAFSPDGQYLSVVHNTTPFIAIYKRSGDTFTKLSNPAALPAGNSIGTTFSPDGQYLSVAHDVSPFIAIYKRDGDTFTKLPNPTGGLPTGTGRGVAFSPDGQYMTVSHTTSPHVTIYKRSGDTFTKLADPAILPAGSGTGTSFTPDGIYMSVSHAISPFVTIYKRSGDTFTKLADPANLPTGTGWGISFSAAGDYLSVAHDVSPFVTIYKRSGDTFTKFTNPSVLPTGLSRGAAFSPTGQYLSIVHDNSPYVTVYRSPTSIAVGASLAAQDTTLNASTNGTPVRLRMTIKVGLGEVGPGDASLKLQYAVRGSDGVCDTTFTGESYGDVSTASGAVRFFDNPNATSGTGLTAHADDPTFGTDPIVRQTYNENNPFNVLDTIPNGSLGMWDFALIDAGAPANTTYCFRVVKSDGSLLTTYSVVPQITTPPLSVSQENWRAYEPGTVPTNDFTKLTNPAALPPDIGEGTAFSPDGTYMSVAHRTSPYITIYKRDGDTFTKLADPATLPSGTANGVAFSPDGNYLSIAHASSPNITIYKRNGDTFTKLANPATLPGGFGASGTAFSSDGTYLSVVTDSSPFIYIYKRDGDTFTKLADPAALPTGFAYGTAFSSDGTYLSVAHATSPFVTIYKRSGDTFTKLADPAALPTGQGEGTAFSPDSNYLSVAHRTSPFVTIYKRSGDTFTKLANPATLPAGDGYGAAWSPKGKYLSVAHVTTPFITIYEQSGDTFTKVANPATLPSDSSFGVDFSPDDNHMSVAHALSPFVTIYKTPPKPTPGTPLATQNSVATITAGNSFRLRQLLEQTSNRSELNVGSYKLQYATKSGTCDVGFSGEAYKDLYAPGGPAIKSGTTAVNDTSVGTSAWANPGNGLASDNAYAEANTSVANTNYLKLTGFGFTIPSDATINGVEVLAEVRSSDATGVTGGAARLVKGGVIGTTNGTNFGAAWPETDTVLTYGTSTDMWGTTLTPADVNASNFGFALSAFSDLDLTRGYVDNIQVKVHYTISTAGVDMAYHATSGIPDKSTISTHANDPTATGTIRPQTFDTTDPFKNSTSKVANGEFAMWDFAIGSSASATGSYCFRVVKSDGSLLASYATIPEITIAGSAPTGPTLNQQVRGGQSVVNGVKAPFSW